MSRPVAPETLARLGPVAADLTHRAWVLPPKCSIRAVIMRELITADDIAASSRVRLDPGTTPLHAFRLADNDESARQAVVAWSREPVKTIPVVDDDGKPIMVAVRGRNGKPEVDDDGNPVMTARVEYDFEHHPWVYVRDVAEFVEYDRWNSATKTMLHGYYGELNNLDLEDAGKAVASGRDWSPSSRTTSGGTKATRGGGASEPSGG
jgi:hypothetical protein